MDRQTYSSVFEQSMLHKERNDCSVKAVAIACNLPYSAAHEAHARAGRQARRGTYHSQTFKALELLGFEVVKLPLPRSVKTMAQAHLACPTGSCLVFVRAHVAAMVDGKVHDWTAGRKHRVKTIFQVIDKKNPVPVVDMTLVEPAPKPKPAPGTVTDEFGSKIGSQSALINETLLDYEWWTIAEIADNTGLSVSRVRNHMRWLMDRGFVHVKHNKTLFQRVVFLTIKEI